MRSTHIHGAGHPHQLRYAYAYSLRASWHDGWYLIEGDLHADAPMPGRLIRERLLADLIAEVEMRHGVSLRRADLRVDHLTYTEVPKGGGQ